MSHDCCVALPPRGAWVCLQFVIVVFPDHTHYFCMYGSENRNSLFKECLWYLPTPTDLQKQGTPSGTVHSDGCFRNIAPAGTFTVAKIKNKYVNMGFVATT